MEDYRDEEEDEEEGMEGVADKSFVIFVEKKVILHVTVSTQRIPLVSIFDSWSCYRIFSGTNRKDVGEKGSKTYVEYSYDEGGASQRRA